MPVFSLTSPKTGKSYKLDINGTPEPDEWDHIGEQLDAQEAQRAGVDPTVLEQGPVGTFVNTVRDVGPGFVGGLMQTGGELLHAAARGIGELTGTQPGGLFQDVARAGEVIQQEGQDLRPTNPFNRNAQLIGSGVQQGMGMLATMGVGGLAAGAKGMTAAPLITGAIQGGGSGVMTAREMGIDNPAGQLALGAGFGAAEVLTEKLGGIGGKPLTEAMQRGIAGTLKQAGKTAGSEFIEEPITGAAQDVMTMGAGQFVSDPNRPGFTTSGYEIPKFDAAFLERRKDEAIGGLAGGAFFGGVQMLMPRNGQGVGQTMSDPGAPDMPESTGELTAAEVADLEQPVPSSQFSVPGSNQAPISPASVTKDSGPTADQAVQQAPGAGLSPAAGALSPDPTGSATRNAEAGPGAPAQIVASPKPNGAAVETETQFVEASDLEPLLQIEVNADQTRDRAGNRGSAEQIASIAVNPDSRLLSDSPVSSIGAPVVDDVVLAGNGRAAGILKGYSDNTPGMARYRADVVRMAAARGQDISGMRQPVMIRKVKRYVSGDRRTFVVESNPKYAALQETTAEAALLDAEALGDVSGFEFTEQGMLTSSSAQQVAIRLKNAQRGVNATTGGKPDVVEATRRVQLAGLARLARDNGVDVSDLSAFLETDTGRRVLAEFTRAAPQLAALDADLGLGDVLLPALKVFNQGAIAVAQRKFSGIGEWAANRRNELIQDDLSLESSTLLDFMVASTRKPTILRQLFESYLEAAANEQDQRNLSRGSADIFGGQRASQPGRDILARQMAGQADATATNLQSPGGQTAGLDAPLMNPARDFTGGLAGSLQQAAAMTRQGSAGTPARSPAPPEAGRSARAPLATAYAQASQGRSTAMAELGDVWAAAKAAQPDLQPGDFIADVMRQYEQGTVLLEGANSRQEADAAGLKIDGTPVGTAVRMAMVGQDNQTTGQGDNQPGSLSDRLPVSKSSRLQSPAELAATEKANIAALKALGLPTKKGWRNYGGNLVAKAMEKIANDPTKAATTRMMASLLAKADLRNLLLHIESDARLRYAGIYQPMDGGRGEIGLNLRALGRGSETGVAGDIATSLVHEALHHATYRALRSPKNAIQKGAIADLEALRKRARAALAANEALSQFDYELSNTDEFIAGLFTRADFQQALAAIPADLAPKSLTQRVRSVLDEIFRTLAELVVGREVPPGSVLDAAFSASLRLMEDGSAGTPARNTEAAKATAAMMNPGWGMVDTTNESAGNAVADMLQYENDDNLRVPGSRLDEALSRLEAKWQQESGATAPYRVVSVGKVWQRGDESPGGRQALGFVDAFQKLTGKQIVWINTREQDGIPFRAAVMKDRSNLIFVHARAPGNLLALIGHEWGHTLAAQDRALYRELQRELARHITRQKGKAMRQELKERYRREIRSEEVTNNIIGDFFTDPAFWREVEQRNKPLVERLVTSVLRWFDELAQSLTRSQWGTAESLTDVTAARSAVAKAFATALQRGPYSDLQAASDAALARADLTPETSALQNPASDPQQRESQSNWRSPDEADNLYTPEAVAEAKAVATAWLDSVPVETALQHFEAGRVPSGLSQAQMFYAHGELLKRLAQAADSTDEVTRMQADALLTRAGRAWHGKESQDWGRGGVARQVVGNDLQGIAPILAAKQVLVDKAERVTKARFEGGGEGVVKRLLDLLKKAEAQAGEQIAQAAADIATPAPVVDPVIAAADVQAVTAAATDYFDGKLPARVKVLHAAGATWDARLNGEVLELNAAALEASQVRGKIEHEIGHLLFREPGLRKSFETIWGSLSAMERAQIENITAALYDANNRNEEASVRALDRVRQMVEARQPSLWQRFVEWVKRTWEKLTGRPPRDPRRLAAQMMETGIARLRGERGTSTEVRESKRGDLLAENSPALVRALNDLRKKMLPGMTWEEIFTDLPSTQKARQRAIYERLKKDQRLQALTPEERLKLTNELDKAWQRERRKVFRRELDKAGVLGEKAPSDRQKVKNAMPKLLRLINLGMFNSEMFREAIAPEYGLRVIDAATAAKLRHLAEAAYSMPEGVMRNKKLGELLHSMQAATGSSVAEIVNSYWTASVLSGLRTQFDTWLAFVNGMGTNLMQAGALLARGQGRNAIGAHAAWWRGLRDGVRESLQILARGDYSVLKKFGADLNETLKGEKNWRPVPLGESLWQNGNVWQKYALAPVMIWTGRLMAAADHVNNTATTAGAMAVARAMHPELYNGRGDFTPQERADARAQALREITGGNPPADKQQRTLVDVRTREILYATVSEELRQAASDIGDTAAYQNDPTGLFGTLYRVVKGALGTAQRALDEKAQDMEAAKMTRALVAALSGSLYGVTGTRFIRFGFNFGADLTRYIPGTALFKDLYGGSKMSRMEQDLLIGKNVIGLMITSTLAALFLTGDDEDEGWQIEGDWSNLTPQEQKSRMAAGIERMTMWKREDGKVHRVSYKQWPTMALFASVGGMLDEKRHRPDVWAQRGVPGHLLRGALTGIYQVKNVTAMRGLMELFGESSFGTDKTGAWGDALIRASSNFIGGAVPTVIKDAAVWNDPRSFKPEGVLESVMRGMPIARKFVNDGRPQLNLLGEEIKLQRTPWSRAYTSVASAEAHRVLGALIARGLSLPQPSDQIAVYQNGVKMPLEKLGREAVWRYEKAVGEGYRAWLAEDGNRLLAMPVAAADKVIAARAAAIKQQALARVTGR